MRLPLQTITYWPATTCDYGDVKIAGLRQASSLFDDVVTIQRALSPFCRQGCLEYVFDTGDKAIKIVAVQYSLISRAFCRVAAPKFNVKMK